jgi:glucokinase
MVAAGVEPAPVIGVDLGGTKILAGVVARDGAILRRSERPTPLRSQEDLLAALDEIVEELLGAGEVAALGFGIPSQIDQVRGMVVSSVNLPLADIDFRDRMRERFELPVGIDNDANAATIAEWQVGAGRGTRHMVMLTLGTGIGGGLILDGRPYRGSTGAGAELGHIVIEHDGPPCQGDCTGRGHLEALASGTAADARARELLGPDATARDLVDRAQEGDEPCREALADIGRKLGSGIGSFLNIFNPELVVVGGGFAAAGELLLGPAREIAMREAVSAPLEAPIVLAELGADAGLVGAGLVAFETLDAAA